jgi:hypothetical protein
MSQAITVSAAINSQNNALLTLLISNNFGEIKSNVFKRVAKENLHKMAYHGMMLVSCAHGREIFQNKLPGCKRVCEYSPTLHRMTASS